MVKLHENEAARCDGTWMIRFETSLVFMIILNWLSQTKDVNEVQGTLYRADSRFAPSKWETSLQSKVLSHWLVIGHTSLQFFMVGDSWADKVWNDSTYFQFEKVFHLCQLHKWHSFRINQIDISKQNSQVIMCAMHNCLKYHSIKRESHDSNG